VLAYLSRYTHRVAISNRRLIALDERGVTFRYKDYRREGSERYQVMTLATDEFIRRFLLHVLPRGFHRIRHYGLLASGGRRGVGALDRSRARWPSIPSCYAMTGWRRTESGRPVANIRFSTATPTAASVRWAAKPRARRRGPISAL